MNKIKNVFKVCADCQKLRPVAYYRGPLGATRKTPVCVDCQAREFQAAMRQAATERER